MLRSLKLLFAKQADPYAGADLDLTRRLGGWFWMVNSVLAVALWPFSPLDRQIGDVGWVIGDVLVAPCGQPSRWHCDRSASRSASAGFSSPATWAPSESR